MKQDAQYWQKLQDVFARARALASEAREQLLDELSRTDPDLAGEVRSLLRADSESGVMDVLGPRLAAMSEILSDRRPERIGPYRVIAELGRGGMGVVYAAERADGQYRQRVAIKLISTSDAEDPLHQRFLAERQILAALVHPNIARLLDGGITEDGRPYLVLEYVDGLPITTYCDRHRLGIDARLRLFADVCAAVQHAHQNLVIHRDLKPSNILVSSDGRVHLLDFGIAKLLNPALTAAHSPATRHDFRAMTPEYASPEQIRGDSLTTASDIYALGVLLYELLSGHRPYRLGGDSPAEIAAAVCEQDPERPSVRIGDTGQVHAGTEAGRAAGLRSTSVERLARQLAGDLDSIVLMALRKEPGRRYASADMLSQDVDRYLSGQPVLAHRGSRRYRIEKFVRRHRIEVTAGALVLTALVTGLSVAIAASRRASLDRDRAEQALAESEGVTNFLMEMFQTGDPAETPPTQLSALDLLQRGARRANQLAAQPAVHARLLDVIGQMSLNLGRLSDAQSWLEQAVSIRRATLGSESLDLAASMIHLAWVHRARRDYESAIQLVTQALEIRRRVLPLNHPDIAEALYELGWLTAGPPQERLYQQALDILPDTGAIAERRITVLQALSTNYRRQGRFDEALRTAREGLTVAELAFGPEHQITGYAMIHLADHVRDLQQDHAGAERLYRQGLTLMTRALGENSTLLLHGLNSLTTLLGERGDVEAESHARRALAIRQSASGPEHPQVADQLQLLAKELARQTRFSEAESLARQAIALSERTLGQRHPVVTDTRLPGLAEVLSQRGRHDDAERTFKNALELTESRSVIYGEMLRDYGRMLLRHGKPGAAEQQLQQSLSVLEHWYNGSTHPNVHETKRAMMELYRQWGKPELVERYRVPPGRHIRY